jgi:outer membrane receptor protein involved in Fe transport
MNTRINYSKSLARPSIRELTPFWANDYEYGTYVIGNPDLKITEIDNADLRYEAFFRSGEYISTSFFFKNFVNHIEIANEGNITWRNAKYGRAYGIELEGKKNIVRNFSVAANFTYIYSRTKVDIIRLDGVRTGTSNRPMFGQAPWVINGLIDYNSEKLGLSAALSYNFQGPKLAIRAPTLSLPDIYELPGHELDFKITKSIGKFFSLELKIRNILQSADTRAYDGDGNSSPSWGKDREWTKIKNSLSNKYTWENVYDSYSFGTWYVLSLAFNF